MGNLHDREKERRGVVPEYKGRTVEQAFKDCDNCVKRQKLILSSMGLGDKDVPEEEILQRYQYGLHKLSLSNNGIYNVPKNLVKSLYNLWNLDLSECEIRGIDDGGWDLPNLRKLNLSGNKIETFPDVGFLASLPALLELNLFDNNLSGLDFDNVQLPETTKLELLDLGYNNLQEFPLGLEKIESLKRIFVYNNTIDVVPLRIVRMPNLVKLDIMQNPLIQPPMETCERGLAAIKRYYNCISAAKATGKSPKDGTKGGGKKLEDKERLKEEEASDKPTSLFPKKEKRTKKKLTSSSDAPSAARRSRSEGRRRVERSESEGSWGSLAGEDTTPSVAMATRSTFLAIPGIGLHPPRGSRSLTPPQVPSGIAMQLAGTDVNSSPPLRMLRGTGRPPAISRVASAPPLPLPPQQGNESSSMRPLSQEAFTDIMNMAAGGKKEQVKPTSFKNRPPTIINNTLKVIFVGASMSGKTSIISRLKYGRGLYPGTIKEQKPNGNYIITFEDGKKSVETKRDAIVKEGGADTIDGTEFQIPLKEGDKVKARRDVAPKMENRTIGVEITPWRPGTTDSTSKEGKGDKDRGKNDDSENEADLEFSVWDFAGQTAYHATHELYFSPRALYVLCWDMGAANEDLFLPKIPTTGAGGGSKKFDNNDDGGGEAEREVKNGMLGRSNS